MNLPSIASTGEITEERSSLKLPTIKSATIRGSSGANKASRSAKHKHAVLKVKSSTGGFALPSKILKNEIANCLEQKRADALGMPTGHAKPNSSEASGKPASASVKINQNFGAATLDQNFGAATLDQNFGAATLEHEMVLEQSTSVWQRRPAGVGVTRIMINCHH